MSAPMGSRVIVLAAGGTGGHMFPAEALAGELLSRGHGVALITDRRGGGFGERLPAVETHRIAAGGLAGTGIVGRAQGVVQLGLGFFQARGLLGRLKPAVAVGFGGYASVPTMLAASLSGVPTVLHEQNAVLGRANRLLAKRATRIATSFSSVAFIAGSSPGAGGDRAVLTGNPVRPGITVVADQPYAAPSGGGVIQILVVGGSQGARVFSRLIPEAIALLPAELQRRLRIAQQARAEDLETARANYAPLAATVELAPFFGDMPERLRAAHLVICRSGASTVAELTAAGRPAILIPYPFATDDHQTANARALDTAGAAWLMPEAQTTPSMLADRLASLAADTERLGRAADVARALGRRDAAARLADLVTSLIRGNGARKEAA
ncbi:MAG TPA: undecaprenyldiphospho-muramoylpentapeptide beta-N-acetylglucosaminyltransferase [Candidatus Acidoferrum sp.]|nr:undecaprenyldiphospho-muramoylpentapeptide beta-N-acetylglucosaminyltransferase [Candidatus Acidoferrum sp.]